MADAGSDPPQQYGLFSVAENEDDKVRYEFRYARSMTADEHQSVIDARALIGRLVTDSEFATLEGYRDDFLEAVDAQMDVLATDRDRVLSLLPKTNRRFADFIHAFRSFDDRTSRWLSRSFGKASEAYTEFKGATHVEFDRSSAYRLCCALRNVSAHSTQVLSSHLAGALKPGGGSTVTLDLVIDGLDLIEKFDVNVRSRREFGASPRMHVVPAINDVVDGCRRAHSRLCVALESEYLDAVALLAGLYEEACEGGERDVWAVRGHDLADPGTWVVHACTYAALGGPALLAHDLAGCRRRRGE